MATSRHASHWKSATILSAGLALLFVQQASANGPIPISEEEFLSGVSGLGVVSGQGTVPGVSYSPVTIEDSDMAALPGSPVKNVVNALENATDLAQFAAGGSPTVSTPSYNAAVTTSSGSDDFSDLPGIHEPALPASLNPANQSASARRAPPRRG